jgi:hypothetical protein
MSRRRAPTRNSGLKVHGGEQPARRSPASVHRRPRAHALVRGKGHSEGLGCWRRRARGRSPRRGITTLWGRFLSLECGKLVLEHRQPAPLNAGVQAEGDEEHREGTGGQPPIIERPMHGMVHEQHARKGSGDRPPRPPTCEEGRAMGAWHDGGKYRIGYLRVPVSARAREESCAQGGSTGGVHIPTRQ